MGKHVITRNPRIGVMHDEHRTWYLVIRSVKPGDAGTYMCQINTEPVTSQVGVVNVVGMLFAIVAFNVENNFPIKKIN